MFARGVVLGVMVAAPVGPVGLLCIRRTLQKGLLMGFATGFGAAFADAFFSAIAALGVSTITDTIESNKDALHLVGGLFLLFIAWHTWRDKPKQADTKAVEDKILKRAHLKLGGVVKATVTSFLITLTNPATLFGVLAVIATLGGLKERGEALAIVAGIFVGSSLWWLMLSGGVSLVRHHFTEGRVMVVNRVTSVILSLIAVWALGAGVIAFASPR